MSLIRSILHMLWICVTIVPWALYLLLASVFIKGDPVYWIGATWLKTITWGARTILGIRTRVSGMENLAMGDISPVILLVKHQSTFETLLMPALMPHPLAYVFKKELLSIPFFGWSMARMSMIHIDRSQGTRAFAKVVDQGRLLMAQGRWVIMFPEGTRIPRGQKGIYKTGGTRLAIETGALVIPIAVTSAKCWPRKAFIKTPGIVDVSIGKPIASVGREPAELMREVEAWIEAEMQRLDPDAYP
jgi:1-acyl-sn-glycerol-3-phosphate acyltransferase